MLAAVGRGYHRQYSTEKESTLEKVRAEATDPNPLPKNPTFFHRLAAIADDIGTHVGVDQEGYQEWYLTQKEKFIVKAMKAATSEVDKKWLNWKANHLDMLVQQSEKQIEAQAKERGIEYFISIGQRLGLCITHDDTAINSTHTPRILGRKRTVLGSLLGRSLTTQMGGNTAPLEQGVASPTTPRAQTIPPYAPMKVQSDPPSP